MVPFVLWGSIGLLVHTYVVFPLVVLARGRLRARPLRTGELLPRLSVVIAAHDEAASIGAKLRTVLDSDYPVERMEVVVASDGSTDETAAIVRGWPDRRVHGLELGRVGKAAALNAALDATDDPEVVVFTDANSLLERTALRALVRPFADPEVGGVAGDQRYLPPEGRPDAHGERSYWGFDRAMKLAQSRAGNVIGATGALYAVRAELVPPVADGVTDDFTTSTAVIAAGRRLVFCPEAVAWEPVAPSTSHEFERKVRVMTRGLRGVAARRELLDVRRHGFYAYQLATHKVLRRLMGVPLLGLVAASFAGRRRSPLHRAIAGVQLTAYAAGAVGLVAPRTVLGRTRPCQLAAYFCMVNAAGVVAATNVVRGRRVAQWDTARTSAPLVVAP